MNASTKTAKTFLIELSPSCGARQNVGIVTHNQDEKSVRFSTLLESDPKEALHYTENILCGLPSEDYAGHLRWSSGQSIALRALGDLRGAMRIHQLAKPLVNLTDDNLIIGNHIHGLGFTHMELGEYERAEEWFKEAERFYVAANHQAYVASTLNNRGLLLTRWNRPSESHAFIDRAIETWRRLGLVEMAGQGMDTKAQAFLAQRDYDSALRVITESIIALRGNTRAMEASERTREKIMEELRGKR